MRKKYLGALIVSTAAMTSTSAHAQFMGIFQGVMSATNQVTGKIGNKLTGGEKPVDLEMERTKFYAAVEDSSKGMDEQTKKLLRSNMEAKWQFAEQSFLMRNAQAVRAKNAPLVDFKKVALDAVGGAALQGGMNMAVLGNSGLGGVLQSAAMDGIVTGVGGKSTAGNPAAARLGAAAMGSSAAGALPSAGMVRAGMAASVAGAATTAVSGVVANGIEQTVSSMTPAQPLGPEYEIDETNHPLDFFGKHPQEWLAKDLYRENGNLGWKLIERAADQTSEAYAPVAGDDHAKVAIFNLDPASGKINAAFRILKVAPGDFVRVVFGVARKLQAEPRYASQGTVLRAVWENGAFVAADTTNVSVGWSALVPATYRAARVSVTQR
jgi:hypothetical protein